MAETEFLGGRRRGAGTSWRRVWNVMVHRRPALVARCRDADDVVAAVARARHEGPQIGVRCEKKSAGLGWRCPRAG